MKVFLVLTTLLILLLNSCSEDLWQPAVDNSDIEEIVFKKTDSNGDYRKINAFPNNLNYYERIRDNSSNEPIVNTNNMELSDVDWNNLVSSIDTKEFNNLDNYNPSDGQYEELFIIEIKINNEVIGLQYGSLEKNLDIKKLHTKLLELLNSFD